MRARWVILAALLVPGAWVPAFLAGADDASPSSSPARAAALGVERPAAAPATAMFAEALGLPLHLPVTAPRLVAFHEASMDGALPMLPLGTCRPCRHPGFRAGPDDGTNQRYAVMDPRGRGSAPTSAVDVVVDRGARILSPVTGRVAAVRPYRLYGRYADTRVALLPEGGLGIEVVLLHLRSGRLAPGDRVVAGVTVLGRVRSFPFRSQVDRYAAGRHPHVHLEVVDARARDEAVGRRGPGR